MEEIYWSKKQGFQCIKQGLDRNRTKIGKPKVANADYNTVAHFYFTGGDIKIESIKKLLFEFLFWFRLLTHHVT